MTKKLTQAVFEGLPSEYLWVAVDADGKCYAFGVKPMVIDDAQWISNKSQMFVAKFVGHDYDATDWQNSLIERETGINVSEENQALTEQEHKKIAERLAAMKATIDEQAAEIATLKESQSDLRGFLHEQIEKNFELLNRQKWISGADELPPQDGTPFLSWNGKTVQLLQPDRSCTVGWCKSHDHVEQHRTSFKPTHWQPLPAPPEGV